MPKLGSDKVIPRLFNVDGEEVHDALIAELAFVPVMGVGTGRINPSVPASFEFKGVLYYYDPSETRRRGDTPCYFASPVEPRRLAQ